MKTIDDLAIALVQAKQKEQEAIATRHSAEVALLDLIESKAEGTAHVTGERFKATATFGFNRTLDGAALEAIRSQVPVALFEQAIEYKPAIKLAGLRYLQQNEPSTYAVLAQAITAKPAKPAVKVEMIAVDVQEAA